MASSPSEIQSRFLSAVAEEHIRGLGMSIWAAYPEAHQLCGAHMQRDQAHDARGVFRRGLAERNFKNYGRRIPGAVVRQERNRIGSSFHVVVEIGGITITQSHADGPNDIIQQAKFRETYAESSQIEMFVPAATTTANTSLYAMLLHGPAVNPKQPKFMAFVFPTRDCEAYVYDATIDLFVKFDDLAQAIRSDRTEVIGDDLMLDLRHLDAEDDDEAASA